jgi:hypothetical protein
MSSSSREQEHERIESSYRDAVSKVIRQFTAAVPP